MCAMSFPPVIFTTPNTTNTKIRFDAQLQPLFCPSHKPLCLNWGPSRSASVLWQVQKERVRASSHWKIHHTILSASSVSAPGLSGGRKHGPLKGSRPSGPLWYVWRAFAPSGFTQCRRRLLRFNHQGSVFHISQRISWIWCHKERQSIKKWLWFLLLCARMRITHIQPRTWWRLF